MKITYTIDNLETMLSYGIDLEIKGKRILVTPEAASYYEFMKTKVAA